jgi:serine/threonine-protein kinase HipA
MGRKSKTRSLDVWMNGEHVGRWTLTNRGEHRFSYSESWLTSEHARPLSVSMPLLPAEELYRGAAVETFFDNLLPDSDAIRREMMTRFQAETAKPFDLLSEVGRDCVGAVQLMPAGTPPDDVRSVRSSALSDTDVAELLRTVRVSGFGATDADDFRVSLAGNQEKTALLWTKGRWHRPKGTTPTTHIVKLPMADASTLGIDMSHSVENEWLCSRLLAAFGVPVARCEIQVFDDVKALVVERFDRKRATDGNWILRLPQEDFCQATATPPGRKYERDGGPGIERVLQILQGAVRPTEDRADFFRTVFLFWLLCAIDGHAKNFSLFIEAGGGFRLTPRYDVISAYPVLGHGRHRLPEQKVKMAMAVHGKNRHYRWREIHVAHWQETALRYGLAHGATELLAGVLDATRAAVDDVSKALPRRFPSAVSEPILEGLRATAKRAKSELKA